MSDVPRPAIPPPNELQLERGADLGRRLHAIAAEVSAWADQVDPNNRDLAQRVEIYSGRVLTGLQSVGTDLGIMAMAMAEEAPP